MATGSIGCELDSNPGIYRTALQQKAHKKTYFIDKSRTV